MSQNQLLIANTVVTVLAASVAFGSFIAGIFGMNLDNDKYQAIPGSFVGVTLLTLIAVSLISIGTVYYFQVTSMLPSELVLERQPQIQRYSRRYSDTDHFVSPKVSPCRGVSYFNKTTETDVLSSSYQSLPEQMYSS